jgi:hypothetical protein
MSLVTRGYSLLAIVEQDSTERLATRLISPQTKIVVDLLFASSGIEPDIVKEAEELDFSEALALPVAQVGHLIAMKTLSQDGSRRPQDRLDLSNLLRRCPKEQLELAKISVRKIQERGFHRGKELEGLLKVLIEEFVTE